MSGHGTLNGYRAHRTNGTIPCDACRRVYERLYGPDAPREDGRPVSAYVPPPAEAKAPKMPSPKVRAGTVVRDECGTEPGYRKHQRMREVPCDGCRRAHGLNQRRFRGVSFVDG